MSFKINHSEGNTNFGPLAPGEYEVFPTAFDKKTASSGNEMVVFNYIIRDDVDQEGQGKEVRYDNFVATEKAMWRVHQASKAAGLEDGKEYDSFEEWAKDFAGKAVRVELGIREFNGKEYNEVKAFKESQVGGEMELAPTDDQGNVTVSDEDLPF